MWETIMAMVLPGSTRTPRRTLGYVKTLADKGDYGVNNVEPASLERANVYTSEVEGSNLHAPILDIDVPCELIPSSTPGHHHLAFNGKPITWYQYQQLLEVLVDCGIVEPGYFRASVARGTTVVRLPWVNKWVKK